MIDIFKIKTRKQINIDSRRDVEDYYRINWLIVNNFLMLNILGLHGECVVLQQFVKIRGK